MLSMIQISNRLFVQPGNVTGCVNGRDGTNLLPTIGIGPINAKKCWIGYQSAEKETNPIFHHTEF